MNNQELANLSSIYKSAIRKHFHFDEMFKKAKYWTITKPCANIMDKFYSKEKDFHYFLLKIMKVEEQKKIEEKKNFFSSILRYKLEEFHSEMLRMILDPTTKHIGNTEYIKIFLEAIDLKRDIMGEGIYVKTEIGNDDYGYIDVIVYDDNYALIIENKINGADDQPNQLARYYKYVEDIMKKEVIAIVYIPCFGLIYEPDFAGYSEEYLKYIPLIKEKLKILSVQDLLKNFIKICASKNDNDVQSFVIGQYSNLLENILGGTSMSIEMEVLREALINLFSTKENIDQIKSIAEIWNRRQEILSKLIWDQLEEIGYEISDDESYVRIKSVKNLEVAFHSNYSRNAWYNPVFGFYSADKFKDFSEPEKKILAALLDETFSEKYYSRNLIDWGKEWIIKEIQMDNCTNIGELNSKTVKKLEELREKVKSKIVV